MRRLQTWEIPGRQRTSKRAAWWDFRRGPAGWVLEIPFVDAGGRDARPSYPEQAAWLAELGLAVSPKLGQVALDADALRRVLDALDVVGTPWEAYEALDAVDALQIAGDLSGALAASERLRDLAPSWAVGRRRRLALLIHGLRDAAAAGADLESMPPGTLDPAEQRRERQTIALLRDDWVSYAAEQAAMIADGARQVWSWEVLGLAHWAAGRLDLARRALDEGLAEHPGNRDLALRLAEVLGAMGSLGEARRLLDALAGEGPPHAKTLALRGWMRREEEGSAAAEDYAAALALDPSQPVARVGRGLQRLAAGDRASARADLEPFTQCGWTEAAEAWRRFLAGEP